MRWALLLWSLAVACSGPPQAATPTDPPSTPARARPLDRPVSSLIAQLSAPSVANAERRDAATLLGAAGGPESRAALRECLAGTAASSLRATCAEALGRTGDREAVALLRGELSRRPDLGDDDAQALWRASALALGRLGGEEAVEALAAELDARRGDELATVLEALAERPSAARRRLVQANSLPTAQALTAPDITRSKPGRTIYVDASADPGDGSAARPFATLAAALAVATPRDTLLITAGARDLPLDAPPVPARLGGTPSAPTVLRAWPAQPPPRLLGPWRLEAPWLLVEDLHLDGPLLVTAHHVALVRLDLGDCEDTALRTSGAHYLRLLDLQAGPCPGPTVVLVDSSEVSVLGGALRGKPGLRLEGNSTGGQVVGTDVALVEAGARATGTLLVGVDATCAGCTQAP